MNSCILSVCLFLCSISFPYEQSFILQSHQYHQLEMLLQESKQHQQAVLCGLLDTFHWTKNEKLLSNIDFAKQQIKEINEQIQFIYQKQNEIRNQIEFHMNNEGNYSPYKIIQGQDHLPVFGAFYIQNKESIQACFIDNISISQTSSSFVHPIPTGNISAGTWAYPDGNLHLGLDIGCDLYSNIYAPANGLVLYADAPVEDNNGYLGNWCGWPFGGGNTICLVVSVQNQLYGITFAHLSSQLFVYPGQEVHQNDVIALSGNSGNSSGPHCHIEVFEIKCSLEEIVSYFQQGADFSFQTGWDQAATCSQYACRIRPETIWG
ncbi:M23 family metallopeptidase [Floccifex sp.]|uniref:M23 family metallopeptidase n=1 Tax=Floccifex sp. TaxID=2815810 RepID=UPI003F0FA8B6